MPTDTFLNLQEQKQDLIIKTAIREFAENPYNVASISNIVRKTGIAKGSFYQYFEDKKDLYQTLIEIALQEKQNLLKTFPIPDPTVNLFSYLRWQFLINVIFEVKNPLLAQVSYRAFVEEVPFPEMTEELRRRGTTQFFKQLISQAILHDEVAVWVDPDMAAFYLETVFYQFGKYFIKRLGLNGKHPIEKVIFDDPQAQQLLDNLMDIIEAGINKSPVQRKEYFNKD